MNILIDGKEIPILSLNASNYMWPNIGVNKMFTDSSELVIFVDSLDKGSLEFLSTKKKIGDRFNIISHDPHHLAPNGFMALGSTITSMEYGISSPHTSTRGVKIKFLCQTIEYMSDKIRRNETINKILNRE